MVSIKTDFHGIWYKPCFCNAKGQFSLAKIFRKCGNTLFDDFGEGRGFQPKFWFWSRPTKGFYFLIPIFCTGKGSGQQDMKFVPPRNFIACMV